MKQSVIDKAMVGVSALNVVLAALYFTGFGGEEIAFGIIVLLFISSALQVVDMRRLRSFLQTSKTFYYRSKESSHGSWVCWGSFEILSSGDPITEPSKDVWFEFGETDMKAWAKLNREITELYGRVTWTHLPMENTNGEQA